MDKQNALGLVGGILFGWLALSLIVPLSSIAVNAILIGLVLASIVLILRVAGRKDAAFVGIGVLIGALVTILVPTLSPSTIQDGSKLLITGVLILLSFDV